jgi:hypothetical protein
MFLGLFLGGSYIRLASMCSDIMYMYSRELKSVEAAVYLEPASKINKY